MITESRVKELFLASAIHYERENYDFFKYKGRLKTASKLKENTTEWGRFKKLANRFVTEENATQFFMINHFDFFLKESKFSKYIGDFYSEENFKKVLRVENIASAYAYHINKALSNEEGIKLKHLIKIDRETQQIPILIQSMELGETDYTIVAALMVCIPKLAGYWLDNSDDEFYFKPLIRALEKYAQSLSISGEQKKLICEVIQQLNA
ncbi:helicase assembly protein [Ochrobactrum phage vB_OspM_OC]|nr:helicase assembly protein [Ochrobactrum phage vB_OspM_OC]